MSCGSTPVCRPAKYASWEEREKKWGAFMADLDWQTVRQQTQAHGPIVEHVRTSLLTTTDFSPKV